MFFFGFGFVGLIAFGVWLFALIDVVTARADQIRNLQKVVWVLIVLFGFEIGAVCYLVWGRPRVAAGGRSRLVGSPHGGPRRSGAPDDDIDFLRSLNRPGDPDGPTRQK